MYIFPSVCKEAKLQTGSLVIYQPQKWYIKQILFGEVLLFINSNFGSEGHIHIMVQVLLCHIHTSLNMSYKQNKSYEHFFLLLCFKTSFICKSVIKQNHFNCDTVTNHASVLRAEHFENIIFTYLLFVFSQKCITD